MNTPSCAADLCVCWLRHIVVSVSCAAFLMGATLSAQVAANSRISGRIFNPATQQYVRNAEIRVEGTDLVAYSADDGSYVIANVPGTEVGLTVTYTGYDVARARVDLGTEKAAVKNFD